MGPTREILWNVPGPVRLGMYLGLFLCLGVTVGTLAWRLRRILLGRPDGPVGGIGQRVRELLVEVLGRGRIWRDPFAGAMHGAMFWGFLVLFAATIADALEHQASVRFLHGWVYRTFKLVVDLGGGLFMVGLLLALWQRISHRRRHVPREVTEVVLLVFLLAVAGTGFLLEGARIAATSAWEEWWPLIGWSLAHLFERVSGDSLPGMHLALWLIHVIAVGAFFLLIPWTTLSHLLFSPLNVLLRPEGPPGLPVTPDLSGLERPGAREVGELTWSELLSLEACTRCGRCVAVCPATAAGAPLSPMSVVQTLKRRAVWVTPEEFWACTSCGACAWECPVSVDPLRLVVELRRGAVEGGQVAPHVARALEALYAHGNPGGLPRSQRADWCRDLGVRLLREGEPADILYWVGCAGAYDPAGQSVARAVVSLLQRAGVSFALLGVRERCTGEPARRLGEEGCFQHLARLNIATLKGHAPKLVLTHCPHCFQVLRREYSSLGGTFAVVHHTEFLARLLQDGRLRSSRSGVDLLTFHDPCQLARGNGVVEAPRQLLAAVPGAELREMPRAKERALCCGGGGGQMWLGMASSERISLLRLDEAIATNARTVATACPYCRVMLESAAEARGAQGSVAVKDVAELLVEAVS
ncbi:MAG: (Fe-S)-binding protein [Candidatus Rokubacteria bacterium]|nr:(Fe-S)-binding protein [Candidatus Rokubacteria bacterium]